MLFIRRKNDKKTSVEEKVRQLNVIDDPLSQKMAEDLEFCEELISTIIQRKVKVIKVTPQNSIKNLQGRSVVLDALCELDNGKRCNVEVQKANNDNYIKRVRVIPLHILPQTLQNQAVNLKKYQM